MTSGILPAINSLMTQIEAIPYDWSAVPDSEKVEPTKLLQLIKMWNNDIARAAMGIGNDFATPACFIELLPGTTTQLLDNVTVTELEWILHLADWELNAMDGMMDQNLTVFGYRDLIKSYIVGFQPANCSTLFFVDEKQDYDHAGIYHYTINFKCCFTDTKGSIRDADQTKVIYSTPPTNLELTTGFSTDLITPPVNPHTSYIWQDRAIYATIVGTLSDPVPMQDLGNGVEIPREYVLNGDGTLTIPYLNTIPGVSILTPFLIGNAPADGVVYTYNENENAYVFDNSVDNGFYIGNEISFNASLPNM